MYKISPCGGTEGHGGSSPISHTTYSKASLSHGARQPSLCTAQRHLAGGASGSLNPATTSHPKPMGLPALSRGTRQTSSVCAFALPRAKHPARGANSSEGKITTAHVFPIQVKHAHAHYVLIKPNEHITELRKVMLFLVTCQKDSDGKHTPYTTCPVSLHGFFPYSLFSTRPNSTRIGGRSIVSLVD